MQLIDIGANLTHDSFDHDRDAVLQRARAAGVARMVVTGASREHSPKALALALNETHQRFPSRQKQILLGLGSALLNPKNALFYLALMTALLGPDVTLLQQATCGVWMVMVVLVWDLALVSLMGLSAVQQKLSRSLWWIERTAGVVLMGFGGWVLWRLVADSVLPI